MEYATCPICGRQHASNVLRIWYLSERVEELESKLGVADAGLSTDREAVGERPITTSSPPAAPSVSADDWRYWARENNYDGRYGSARACDLAAAVTEWYQRLRRHDADEADLLELVGAFVRGEPLPEKRNG